MDFAGKTAHGAGRGQGEQLRLLRSGRLTDAGFAHAFTTRAGGVSPAPFETLDFAILRHHEARRENERRLGEALGFDPTRLFHVRQVHGADVLVAAGAPQAFLAREADALIAEPGSGVAVAVRVADCVPILVADPVTGRAAAVHAGWRGVVAKILGATVTKLAAAAGNREVGHYLAAIGPCIGACCFEVGADVGGAIASASIPSAVARTDEARGKDHVDLRAAVRAQLRTLGLDDANVEDVPGSDVSGCTRCNPETFYSYRRDGDDSGRLLGVIVPKGSAT